MKRFKIFKFYYSKMITKAITVASFVGLVVGGNLVTK
jgi:hypothetical protein